MIGYHDLRKLSPGYAREVNDNVSKTAKLVSISRKTVRRARDGSLSDLSRRPKSS